MPPKKASGSKKATSKAAAKKTVSTKKAAAQKASPSKKTTKKAVAKTGAAKKASAANEIPAAVRDKADSAPTSRFFKRATERARRIANDPKKLREIAEKADRSSASRSGPFAAVLDEFRALVRLVVAYARGHYRQIPFDKLVVVVAGLIYVVSPIDVIPDAIPVAGFVDDVTVIGWVLKMVREEVDAFREWEVGLTD